MIEMSFLRRFDPAMQAPRANEEYILFRMTTVSLFSRKKTRFKRRLSENIEIPDPFEQLVHFELLTESF